MPHLRERIAINPLKKLAKLWPVVGLMGLRQVGKSTLIRDLLGVSEMVTFDDDDSKSDAENSPKVFLAKYERPMAIDEVQKVNKIFDAIKSEVDKKRIPGNFFLTGSQRFSSGELTRESLTGRMGTLRLYPMTFLEGNDDRERTLERFVHSMQRGGLPVPMFLRDDESRRLYWSGWLDTTLVRDLARAYGKGYDLDLARLILDETAAILAQGLYPEISLYSKDSRKVQKYLKAMESIFLLNRIACHPQGTGRDHWLMGDSGLACHLLGSSRKSEKGTLSLARHYLYNEIAARKEYALKGTEIYYYKSPRGEPVDFVVGNLPIKIINKSSGSSGWFEKGLEGALMKLKSNKALLMAPIEKSDPIKKRGISRVSWLLPALQEVTVEAKESL